MTQWPPASQPDQPTSQLAEKNITKSGKRQTHAFMILRYLYSFPEGGHVTASEIARAIGLTESQVHKRTSDLLNLGKIKKTEARVCKVNHTLRATWQRPQGQLAFPE